MVRTVAKFLIAAIPVAVLAAPAAVEEEPCLCIFDIDRTLTGRQGDTSRCPENLVQPGVPDTAYGGGPLTLSALAQGVNETFCGACYIGTVSAGDASGPGSAERAALLQLLRVRPDRLPTTEWSAGGCYDVTSPLVTSCRDGRKQAAVLGILAWYRNHVGVSIPDAAVHFFDDRASNVRPFQGLPYNARQISCAGRDIHGAVGLCGATLSEIVPAEGVALCPSTVHQVPPQEPCLCIFDIDRTLTGRQGDTADCPVNSVQAGIPDMAYGGGMLTLSALAQQVNETFCGSCYLGTISAGDASGPGSPERANLLQHLSVRPDKLPTADWSRGGCFDVTSPLVTSCRDGMKQLAVPQIMAWYKSNAGVDIADAAVHFFDDRSGNVEPFHGLPYNARQVSCATRDFGGTVGLCGATPDEIVPTMGVATCEPVSSAADLRSFAAAPHGQAQWQTSGGSTSLAGGLSVPTSLLLAAAATAVWVK